MDQPLITSLLDLDAYKLTMLYYIYCFRQSVYVKTEFINRHSQPLAYQLNLGELNRQLQYTQALTFTPVELYFLSQLTSRSGRRLFGSEFITFLSQLRLPTLKLASTNDQLQLTLVSSWTQAELWETLELSLVNQLHSQFLVDHSPRSLAQVIDSGKAILEDKIRLLRQHPEVRFADFGTRRRFSFTWQDYVLRRLKTAFAGTGQFLGTSNLHFARTLDLPWVGTQAHELFMVEAALAISDEDKLASQTRVLDLWQQLYGPDLLTALTDTFGTHAFFAIFAPYAASWNVRQDSGDPFVFGDQYLEYLNSLGLDPLSRTIVFSDGLSPQTMIDLATYFTGRTNVLFGWGTNLTNDLGLSALSIVAKVTAAGYSPDALTPTVKLSDTLGKETGPSSLVEHYRTLFTPVQHARLLVY